MSSDKKTKEELKAERAAKKAAKLAKQEEERRLNELLESLRASVSLLTQYQKPEPPLSRLAARVAEVLRRPFTLIRDVRLAHSFFTDLHAIMEQFASLDITAFVSSLPSPSQSPRALSENQAENEAARPSTPPPDLPREQLLEHLMPKPKPVLSEEEAEAKMRRDLHAVFTGLHELSEFAQLQPCFIFASVPTLQRLVQLLSATLTKPTIFHDVLGLLSPTLQAPQLAGPILETDLIPVLLQFGEFSPLVLSSIAHLSASPSLRARFKEESDDYLHLRSLAAGSTPGWTEQQQQLATEKLELFIRDSVAERDLGANAGPRGVNAAMLRYYHGHVYALYDAPNALDEYSRGRQRRMKHGFLDAKDLEALNRKKRRHA